MVDVYSNIPLQLIYPVGGIILIVIAWSLLREAAKADRETRKKLVKIYAGLFVGCVLLIWGFSYFNVSEKLFPSFYEHEELRQQLNNPWDLDNYQSPFR